MTLPEVPSNVVYEFHPNGCYDWGTIGWVLENGKINWRKYKYFIFMNSSVRGPYLPPAMQGLISWQELLLNKIAGNVKLVGSTISCEGSPFEGNIAGEWRTNPHVQSYVIATDQVGLLLDGQGLHVSTLLCMHHFCVHTFAHTFAHMFAHMFVSMNRWG